MLKTDASYQYRRLGKMKVQAYLVASLLRWKEKAKVKWNYCHEGKTYLYVTLFQRHLTPREASIPFTNTYQTRHCSSFFELATYSSIFQLIVKSQCMH